MAGAEGAANQFQGFRQLTAKRRETALALHVQRHERDESEDDTQGGRCDWNANDRQKNHRAEADAERNANKLAGGELRIGLLQEGAKVEEPLDELFHEVGNVVERSLQQIRFVLFALGRGRGDPGKEVETLFDGSIAIPLADKGRDAAYQTGDSDEGSGDDKDGEHVKKKRQSFGFPVSGFKLAIQISVLECET